MKLRILTDQLTTWMTTRVHHARAARWAVPAVYGWFLVNALLTWNERSLIWGMGTVLQRFGASDRVIDNLVYMLVYDLARYPLVFGIHLAAAALAIFSFRWAFVPRALTWATGLLLYFGAIPAYNSGMLVMLLLAFYLIPVHVKAQHPLTIALHNAGLLAARVQVVLCYAFSAVYKLMGAMWVKGTAVYYALNIDRFTTPWMQSLTEERWLMLVMNYAGLAYQVLFPVLIWTRRWKGGLLVVGVLFHLFIGAVMHLWDFALAMIFSYTLFLTEKKEG